MNKKYTNTLLVLEIFLEKIELVSNTFGFKKCIGKMDTLFNIFKDIISLYLR